MTKAVGEAMLSKRYHVRSTPKGGAGVFADAEVLAFGEAGVGVRLICIAL